MSDPNQILLAPHHDISGFCSSDESKYVLTGVYYSADKKRLEATDGRMAITLPVMESSGEYPATSTQQKEPPRSCIIPGAKLREILDRVPINKTLPILRRAKLDTIQGNDERPQRVFLSTTDLDAEYVVRSKVIESEFPNIDKAVTHDCPPAFKISLNPRLLKKIADYACQYSSNSNQAVVIECWGEMSPVRMTIHVGQEKQEAVIHLMPMKSE